METEGTILKAERRELQRRKQKQMGVSGRSLLTTIIPTIVNAGKKAEAHQAKEAGQQG